jgi:tetratricopeptide (TPR) repeat protein
VQGQYEVAVRVCEEAQGILARLTAHGVTDATLTPILAQNRAALLMRLHRYADAEEGFAEAVTTTRTLAAAGEEAAPLMLAGALLCRGNALNMLDHPDEALRHYEEAIGAYRPLVRPEGNGEAELGLAGALARRGYFRAGPARARIPDLDEALTIVRRMVASQGRDELVGELTFILFCKGALCYSARAEDEALLPQALDCYDEAIALHRERQEHVPPVEDLLDLANLLVFRLYAAEKLRRWPVALASFTEAIGLYLRAAEQGYEDATAKAAELLSDYASLLRRHAARPGVPPALLPEFNRALHAAARACRERGLLDPAFAEACDEFVRNEEKRFES